MLDQKTLTKKLLNIFWFHVQDFNISEIFYKIQNLKKWQMKAVNPFLPSIFHFLRFRNFVKDVSNIDILNLDTENIRCSFLNVFFYSISSWNCYYKHDTFNLFCMCISYSCFFLNNASHSWHCNALNIISTWKVM